MKKISCLIFLLYSLEIGSVINGAQHSCVTALEIKHPNSNELCNFLEISQEQMAWENLLKKHLGSYYYPRYINSKNAGKETAWDYVKDDPVLPRLLIIGDSISRGYTLPLRRILRGKLNVHRAPQNCRNTDLGIKNLDVWLGDKKWDLIIYNFGIHDRNTPENIYRTRLSLITERLKKTGAVLIWVTTTSVPEGANEYIKGSIERLNMTSDRLMKEQEVTILDINHAISPFIDKYQITKNCHFKNEGYAFMSKLISNTVLTALQIE